mgnify:FL=1
MSDSRSRLLVVSGMSGAGKSSALKIVEDLGYEAVDNLPLSLLQLLMQSESAASAGDNGRRRAIAVGIDARTRDFLPETFATHLAALRERVELEVQFLFLDCDDAVLQSRFTATRRRHPLAADRPIADGIAHERRLMAGLKDSADLVIDTSELAQPALRELLAHHYALGQAPGLTMTVLSFSYRHGLPREADLVFDMRFLRNPYYVQRLSPLTGEDAEVGAYIAADPTFQPFFQGLSSMLLSLLPHYSRGGKSYLTIAIGCTGGRHRSVYAAVKVAGLLRDEGYQVTLRHRDIGGSGG